MTARCRRLPSCTSAWTSPRAWPWRSSVGCWCCKIQAEKLKVADDLARLYEGTLDDAVSAVVALDLVRELEPENFDAVSRLAILCEKLEDWPRFAKHLAELIEVEGDEQEVSRMTRRLAEVLHEKVKKSDDALAVLMQVADAGDEPCREEYVRLGDSLGWKGVVASKLVEWYLEHGAESSAQRRAARRVRALRRSRPRRGRGQRGQGTGSDSQYRP